MSIILSSILTSYFDDGLPESVNFFLSHDGLPRLANASCVVSSGFQRLAISISTRLIVCLIPAYIRGTAFGVDLFVESALFAHIITIQLAQALVADSSGAVDRRGTCIFGGSQSAITVATIQGLSAFLCAVPPEPGVFIESQNFLRIELRTASFSASISTAFWSVGTPTITSVNPLLELR